jgi:DNA-binding MarR family transcriptional regulator
MGDTWFSPKGGTMTLEGILKCVAELRKIDSEMPLPQVHCLFLLAKAGETGMSLTELSKAAEIAMATASRYIGNLGKINRFKEEGFNLVEAYEDPMERRKKIIRLTPKGRVLINRLIGDTNANLSKRK